MHGSAVLLTLPALVDKALKRRIIASAEARTFKACSLDCRWTSKEAFIRFRSLTRVYCKDLGSFRNQHPTSASSANLSTKMLARRACLPQLVIHQGKVWLCLLICQVAFDPFRRPCSLQQHIWDVQIEGEEATLRNESTRRVCLHIIVRFAGLQQGSKDIIRLPSTLKGIDGSPCGLDMQSQCLMMTCLLVYERLLHSFKSGDLHMAMWSFIEGSESSQR